MGIAGDPFSPFCRALRQAVTYRVPSVLSTYSKGSGDKVARVCCRDQLVRTGAVRPSWAILAPLYARKVAGES